MLVKLIANDIEERLLSRLLLGTSGGVILPRYTPRGWWEADVFYVTSSGYFREYEIKVSKSDFLADAKKDRWAKSGVRYMNPMTRETKHELLESGCPEGPRQFYFCLPLELFEKVQGDIPDFAGVFALDDRGLITIRPAPILHREKIAPGVVSHANKNGCIRYVRAEIDRFRKVESK